MTIDEAIKILTTLESRSINNSLMFKKDALKLGIEALKFIKGLHDTEAMPNNARLPGETKD